MCILSSSEKQAPIRQITNPGQIPCDWKRVSGDTRDDEHEIDSAETIQDEEQQDREEDFGDQRVWGVRGGVNKQFLLIYTYLFFVIVFCDIMFSAYGFKFNKNSRKLVLVNLCNKKSFFLNKNKIVTCKQGSIKLFHQKQKCTETSSLNRHQTSTRNIRQKLWLVTGTRKDAILKTKITFTFSRKENYRLILSNPH